MRVYTWNIPEIYRFPIYDRYIPGIENNLRNDEANDDMIMRVADSAQVCFNEEHVLNGLRSSPSNSMYKADTLMYRDQNSIIISINRLAPG